MQKIVFMTKKNCYCNKNSLQISKKKELSLKEQQFIYEIIIETKFQ